MKERLDKFDFKKEDYDKKIIVDAEGTARAEPLRERDQQFVEEIEDIVDATELDDEEKLSRAYAAHRRWYYSNATMPPLPRPTSPTGKRIARELREKQRQWEERERNSRE